jgi:hypothetical protein
MVQPVRHVRSGSNRSAWWACSTVFFALALEPVTVQAEVLGPTAPPWLAHPSGPSFRLPPQEIWGDNLTRKLQARRAWEAMKILLRSSGCPGKKRGHGWPSL